MAFAAERVGEFFLPSGAVAKGAKAVQGARALANAPKAVRGAATLGTRAGLEAGTVAGVTAAQTGGDVKAIKEAATVAGAIPVAGKVVEPAAQLVKRALSTRLAGRLVDSLIKPSKAQVKYGQQPGQEVAKLGLKANSLGGLGEEIAMKKGNLGKQIDRVLNGPAAANKRIDIVPLINGPIDAAIVHARVTTGNHAIVARLENLREALLRNRFGLEGLPKAVRLAPADARKLKTAIGDAGAFRGTADPIEGTAKDVSQKIYRNLKDAINKEVPRVRALNGSYSNLESAAGAVADRVDAIQKMNFLGLTDAGLGVATAFITEAQRGNMTEAVLLGLIASGASKAAGSTPVKTRLASMLAQLSPGDRTIIARQVVPMIRNLFLASKASEARR